MTTTVKELKEWLAQFPEETEVEFLERECHYFNGESVTVKPANLGPVGNWEFSDFTKNQFVKEGHPAFGRKILILGDY